MKTLYILFLAPLIACTPTLPGAFVSSAQYDRNIKRYDDPVHDLTMYSVQLGSRSEEKLAYYSRFNMKMEVIRSTAETDSNYTLRFVLSSSPEEWPVEETAYLYVNNKPFVLPLKFISPRNVANISGSAMDGNVSINSSELQILRIESSLPVHVLEEIGPSTDLSLVFHSGNIPITFRLDETNMVKLISLVHRHVDG